MLASNTFVRRASQSLCGLALVLGLWVVQSSSAQAQTTIAADLDLQVPVSVNGVGTGGGFGIRIGQELHLPLIAINPEIGFTYASFSKDEPPTVYRGIAGLRAGFGELIRFGVLAHVGFGYVNWSPRYSDGRVDVSHTGFTYDVGAFLEFTALPLLNLGVHLIYNRVSDDDNQEDSLHWLSLGVHATLVL